MHHRNHATPTLASTSATALIRADHGAALALYRKLDPGCAEGVRDALVRRLCLALEIHAQVEEEIFYPALRQAGITAPQLDKSDGDHQRMREGIERLRSMPAGADPLRALHETMNGVMHHMADEETQLLPLAEQSLGTERLGELGRQMSQRKHALARSHAGETALDVVRAAPAKSGLIAVGLLAAAWMLVRPHRHARLQDAY